MNQHPTVDELIECPKKIIKSDRKNMIEKNRSYRNNIQLESEDGKYSFIMFMRQSAEFLEDFSVAIRLLADTLNESEGYLSHSTDESKVYKIRKEELQKLNEAEK